jgi:hypothetical protein
LDVAVIAVIYTCANGGKGWPSISGKDAAHAAERGDELGNKPLINRKEHSAALAATKGG